MRNYTDLLRDEYGISDKAISIFTEAEKNLADDFKKLDDIARFNQLKVLNAFQKNKISYAHFGETSGYGYDDMGRDALDRVFADTFGAEDAIVRHNIVSGTQAIASCLYGVLRPGDKMLSVVGAPYDTMEEVIGIRGGNDTGSLKDFGIDYGQIDLLPDGEVDHNKIMSTLKEEKIKLVLIQRSRGYAWRDSLTVEKIEKIINSVKSVSPDTICMIDNCYGEFVETEEPTQVGADIIVGSLIKNPGGSIALSGGYIAGKAEYIEKISYRLTAPGIGREVGASLGFNRNLYQGFFMSPHIVAQSIKVSMICAKMFKDLGYDVCPEPDAKRSDIIQAVKFNDKDKLIKFCQSIQYGSAIDSFVTPEPWDMPGYDNPVIMAAGAFVQGASIELSADAPICEPYIAYLQGGVIYDSAIIGVLKAYDAIKDMN